MHRPIKCVIILVRVDVKAYIACLPKRVLNVPWNIQIDLFFFRGRGVTKILFEDGGGLFSLSEIQCQKKVDSASGQHTYLELLANSLVES